MKKKKILFFAEYITLSHPGRCFALAEGLDPDLYDIAIAVSPRVKSLIPSIFSHYYPLESISGEKFLSCVTKGRVPYSRDTLEQYVIDDLKIIQDFKPDLIIGDFRLSLGISARQSKIPYCNIGSVYWEPEKNKKFIVPDLFPMTHLLPLAIGQTLFNWISPIIFRRYCLPFNSLRKKHNLPDLPKDLTVVYTEGDYILYDDIFSFTQIDNFLNPNPVSTMHLGPINWAMPGKLPNWWHHLPTEKPIILVSVGSSGNSRTFNKLLKCLSTRTSETYVVITAKNNLNTNVPGHIILTDYLPIKSALESCTLFIGNGGISSYLALAAGIPALGIPYILDQYLCCHHLDQSGATLTLRSDRVTMKNVSQSLDRLLKNPFYKNNAKILSDKIKSIDSKIIFSNWVEKIIAHHKTSP